MEKTQKILWFGLFTVSLALILTACGGGKETKQSPAEVEQPVTAQEVAATYGQYGRLARVTVHDILSLDKDEDPDQETGVKASILKRVDDATLIKLFATGYQSSFSETEVARVADFLESPKGQEGVGILGNWLLSGKCLTDPAPLELYAMWKDFTKSAEGVKFIIEVAKLYRKITRMALEMGIEVLKNADPGIFKIIAPAVLKSL